MLASDYIPSPATAAEGENYEYFLDRDRLRQDLSEKNDDFKFDLIRQYDRRIQSALRELTLDSQLPIDARMAIATRRDDTLNISVGILSSMYWQLPRCAERVNVYRFRSLMTYLSVAMFRDVPEFKRTVKDREVFEIISNLPMTGIDESQAFVQWFYARWVLFVDRIGRFPFIVSKPTVNNPVMIFDNNLNYAENHGRAINEVRQYNKTAVKLLNGLMAETRLTGIRIPTVECFLLRNPIGEENFDVWENKILPDFDKAVFVPRELIVYRTKYDLLVANFAASNIRTSKVLCRELLDTKIDFSTVDPTILPYLVFPQSDLALYASCLGLTPPPKPLELRQNLQFVFGSNKVPEIVTRSLPLPNYAISCSKAETKGFADEVKEATVAQPTTSRARAGVVLLNGAHSILSTVAEEDVADLVPEPCTIEQFKSSWSSPPAIFTDMATLDWDVMKQSIGKNPSSTEKPHLLFPERMKFPPLMSNVAYKSIPKELHWRVFLLLGKMNQFIELRCVKRWEAWATIFHLWLSAINMDHNTFKFPLVVDTIQTRCLNYLGALDGELPADFFNRVKSVFESIATQINDATLRLALCSQLLGGTAPVFINTERYSDLRDLLATNAKDDLYRPLYLGLIELIQENEDSANRFVKVLNIVFRQLANKAKNPTEESIVTDFVHSLQFVTNGRAIRLLMSYCLSLYNTTVTDNPEHFLVPTAAVRACTLLPGTPVISEPTDFPVDIHRTVLKGVLRHAIRLLPTDPYVLRAYGDYNFTAKQYDTALRLYLNFILVFTDKLTQPLHYKSTIDDLFWYKAMTCMLASNRATEAAITGHLVQQMYSFVPQLAPILAHTPASLDAGPDLFPFVGDLAVFKHMVGAYGKVDQKGLQKQLVNSVMTRSFAPTSVPKQQVMHEALKRKTAWLRLLATRCFDPSGD